MSSKNKKRNAFFYFVIDFMEESKMRGTHYRNFAEASNNANPIWRDMSEEQRHEYKVMAKKNPYCQEHEPVDCFGEKLSAISNREQEQQNAELKMKNNIHSMVNVDRDKLKTQNFVLAHINYHCKNQDGTYIPAEIALVKFNLQNGVQDIFHTIINPGNVGVGNRLDAQEHSDRFHKISIDYESGCNNYAAIYHGIINFVKDKRTKELNYLFTADECYVVNHNFEALNDFINLISVGFSEVPEVYSLSSLLYELRNSCYQSTVVPSESFSKNLIEQNPFILSLGISCKFHQYEVQETKECSLSKVVSWVYLLCDLCCSPLNIDLKVIHHKPDLRGASILSLKKSRDLPTVQTTYYDNDRDDDTYHPIENVLADQITNTLSFSAASENFPPLRNNAVREPQQSLPANGAVVWKHARPRGKGRGRKF